MLARDGLDSAIVDFGLTTMSASGDEVIVFDDAGSNLSSIEDMLSRVRAKRFEPKVVLVTRMDPRQFLRFRELGVSALVPAREASAALGSVVRRMMGQPVKAVPGGATPAPLALTPGPAPLAPSGLSAASAEDGPGAVLGTGSLLDALKDHLRELAAKDHFGVLGVGRSASGDEVRRAFMDLAKEWHPARFAVESEEVRETVAEVFIAIKGAYDVLSSDGRRTAYVSRLAARESALPSARPAPAPTHPRDNRAAVAGPQAIELDRPASEFGRTPQAARSPARGANVRSEGDVNFHFQSEEPSRVNMPGLPESGPAAAPARSDGAVGAAQLSASAELLRAEHFLAGGFFRAAEQALDRALRVNPDDKVLRSRHAASRAYEAHRRGDAQVAAELFQEALAQDPNYSPAAEALRILLQQRKDDKRGLIRRLFK